VAPVGYAELLEQVKVRVRTSRVQAARAVNTELVGLYWQIGHLILNRQESEGWGSKVIGRLAADLRAEFPGMRGLSQRSLVYMRTFAAAFAAPIAQQPAAQLPWGHIMVLLDKVTDSEARQWYAAQAVEYGWSRAVLTHHIATNRHARVGAAPNNFPTTLAAAESDLAREIVQDPYDLDFLALDPGYTERELEDALVARMTHFFTELGDGFAFVGAASVARIRSGSRSGAAWNASLRCSRWTVSIPPCSSPRRSPPYPRAAKMSASHTWVSRYSVNTMTRVSLPGGQSRISSVTRASALLSAGSARRAAHTSS